jgi:hypothetical protein
LRIGSLLALASPAYLYQDSPMFPWDKLPAGTMLIVLGEDPTGGNVEVLVGDGRRGWIAQFLLHGCEVGE